MELILFKGRYYQRLTNGLYAQLHIVMTLKGPQITMGASVPISALREGRTLWGMPLKDIADTQTKGDALIAKWEQERGKAQ